MVRINLSSIQAALDRDQARQRKTRTKKKDELKLASQRRREEDQEIKKRDEDRARRREQRLAKRAELKRYQYPPVVITKHKRSSTEERVARAAIQKIADEQELRTRLHELHYIAKAIVLLEHEQTSIWRAFDAVTAARHSTAIDNVNSMLERLVRVLRHQSEHEQEISDEPEPQQDWLNIVFAEISDRTLSAIQKSLPEPALEGMDVQRAGMSSPLLKTDWIIDIDHAERIRVSGRRERRNPAGEWELVPPTPNKKG